MSDHVSRSPMKRMRSLRLKKNRNTLKQPAEAVNIQENTVKWEKNPDVIGTVIHEVQNGISGGQQHSPENHRTDSSITESPRLRKNGAKNESPRLRKNGTRSNVNKSHTKSTRFFTNLLPTRTKTPDKTHIQQIDLREIEICQQIGCGASSAGVFLCIVDGWACAMKQLKREYVAEIDIRCFEREMDILYQLPPHPSIVRYLFHTSHGKDLCLFMQLYSGTLREYLDERRKTNQLLAPDKIAQLALESAQGIQFLHQHGVIHRDIKAGNCFITKNEEGEVTRIAIGDFDTSLRVSASIRNITANSKGDTIVRDEHDEPASFTTSKLNNRDRNLNTAEKRNFFAQSKPKSTVGTAGFMAPEVLRSQGATPYGFKVDVYSFGMLLYEMLTLKLPYESLESAVDVVDAVLEGIQVDSMKIDQLIKEKYRSLVDLYQHCTRMNPEERPSIDQVIRELVPMVNIGNFTMPVERKASLAEQLNSRLSLTRSSGMNMNSNIDSNILDKVMEEDMQSASIETPVVKFGGPQTQKPPVPTRPRVPSLGNPSRDRIIQEDDITESNEVSSGGESRFKSLKDAMDRKKKKKSSSKDKDKKSKRLKNGKKSSKSSVTDEISTTETEEVPLSARIHPKRPKRNTISKSTLQRMMDDPDAITHNT